MKKLLIRGSLALSLFGLGFTAGLVAQSASDSPQRVEQKRTGPSGAPGMEVIASIAEYKCGEGIEQHMHHGVEAAYVVQGAQVPVPAKEPTMRLEAAVAALDVTLDADEIGKLVATYEPHPVLGHQ